jgi:glucosyl-dolichyl phosphate glucuronosyltransferase
MIDIRISNKREAWFSKKILRVKDCQDMQASIIICTYNRASYLSCLLNSLSEQTFPSDKFEIVLVNDGSTDNSDEIIRQYQNKFSHLKYIQKHSNTGLASAANDGILSATSEILLFTDDDCKPSPDWVQNMVHILTKFPIVCGQILTEEHPYLSLARNIAEYHPFLLNRNHGYLMTIAGANMGFQRKVFDEVGMFQAGCATPDMEFFLRTLAAGYQVKFGPECKVIHNPVYKTIMQTCVYEASRSFSTIRLRKKYKRLLKTPFVLESAFLILLLSPILSFLKAGQVFFKNRSLLKYLHTFPVVVLLKFAWCIGAARGLWVPNSSTAQ